MLHDRIQVYVRQSWFSKQACLWYSVDANRRSDSFISSFGKFDQVNSWCCCCGSCLCCVCVCVCKRMLYKYMYNAVKFTSLGGTVYFWRMIVCSKTKGSQPSHVLSKASVVSVSGTDDAYDSDEMVDVKFHTGCGTSSQSMAHLFEAYTQAKASIVRNHGSTGPGLAIVHKLSLLWKERFLSVVDWMKDLHLQCNCRFVKNDNSIPPPHKSDLSTKSTTRPSQPHLHPQYQLGYVRTDTDKLIARFLRVILPLSL